MEMEIGIDKLEFTSQDFKVQDWGIFKSYPRLGLGKEPYKPKDVDYLLTDSKGDPCYHQKLIWNPSIESKFGDSNFNLTINQFGFNMTLNPSKYEADKRSHIHPISDTDLMVDRVLNTTKFINENLGIDFDTYALKLSRVDVTRNLMVKYQVRDYADIFELMQLPRSTQTQKFPSGFLGGNGSRGLLIYDKIEQIKNQNKDKNLCSQLVDMYGNHLMRVEVQAKRSNAVKSCFGIKCFGDLASVGIPHLQTQYKKIWQQDVFKGKSMDLRQIQFDNLVAQMLEMKQISPRSWFTKLASLYGVTQLIVDAGGYANLISACKEVVGNRMALARCRNEIKSMMNTKQRLSQSDSLTKMYDEIYRKLVA